MDRNVAPHHILVLEDDESIAELLTWILTDVGYEVTSVETLCEARKVCSQEKPDLIIADLLLPDGLGSELVHEVKAKHNGNSPASIMMSAVPQAPNHAKAAGAQLCLPKPFDLDELLDAVSDLTGADGHGFGPRHSG